MDVSETLGAGASAAGRIAVPKTLFLDIRAALNAAGIPDTQIPAKLEGAAFGADVTVDGVVKHTLYIGNDNDFLAVAPGGLTNPNQWFVFTFTDADLVGPRSVPEVQRRTLRSCTNRSHPREAE